MQSSPPKSEGMTPPTFLSLFSGIGGLDLGLERAGFRCVGQVECDPFCRRVLAKHWPDVPRFDDVRTFTKDSISGPIDLIAGGFPCQDISLAGKHAGIEGARSGLWSEFFRLIREIRPFFVLVENVAALLIRGIERVLGDLAAGGYDAEWDCLPASSVGAPHERDRVFIVAYPEGSQARPALSENRAGIVEEARKKETSPAGRCPHLPGIADWSPEPRICRVDDGTSANVDRVSKLGNAVVPQIAEFIGRRILSALESEAA